MNDTEVLIVTDADNLISREKGNETYVYIVNVFLFHCQYRGWRFPSGGQLGIPQSNPTFHRKVNTIRAIDFPIVRRSRHTVAKLFTAYAMHTPV